MKSVEKEFPVLRLMARDYLAIPGSTCLAERSFLMSARTDDCRRRQMSSDKFGGSQRLQAVEEAWLEIEADFDSDDSDLDV